MAAHLIFRDFAATASISSIVLRGLRKDDVVTFQYRFSIRCGRAIREESENRDAHLVCLTKDSPAPQSRLPSAHPVVSARQSANKESDNVVNVALRKP